MNHRFVSVIVSSLVLLLPAAARGRGTADLRTKRERVRDGGFPLSHGAPAVQVRRGHQRSIQHRRRRRRSTWRRRRNAPGRTATRKSGSTGGEFLLRRRNCRRTAAGGPGFCNRRPASQYVFVAHRQTRAAGVPVVRQRRGGPGLRRSARPRCRATAGRLEPDRIRRHPARARYTRRAIRGQHRRSQRRVAGQVPLSAVRDIAHRRARPVRQHVFQ